MSNCEHLSKNNDEEINLDTIIKTNENLLDSINVLIEHTKTTNKKEDLGDRIKKYESVFTGKRIDPSLPFVMRLDGHAFSKFVGGLNKPYDYNLHQAFINTTISLMKQFHADTAYTHSDEISLLFYPKKQRNSDEWREPFFGGRIQKLISIAAGFCTMTFNKELLCIFYPLKDDYTETTYNRMINSQTYFDCRLFQLPNDNEMFSYMFWRSKVDCTRNNVYELARRHYSKKELDKKSTKERINMLANKSVIWENEPACFRHGSFIKRIKIDNKESSKIKFTFKQIDVDLIKFSNEINELLKCEVIDNNNSIKSETT